MPAYDYSCHEHGVFEVKRTFDDTTVVICPECSYPAKKLIRPAAISFKGGGFYRNDYRG